MNVCIPGSGFQPIVVQFFLCPGCGLAYDAVTTSMSTEADTCRKFVVPKLQSAGWNFDPHSIAEQRRIVARLETLFPAVLDRAFKGELLA